MADSDGEYVQNVSSGAENDHDDDDVEYTTETRRHGSSSRRNPDRRRAGGTSGISRGKERARERWEGSLEERNVREFGAAGAFRSAEELNRIMEARKRAR
jgi:hypothetical protein